jgi:hypothetical protein
MKSTPQGWMTSSPCLLSCPRHILWCKGFNPTLGDTSAWFLRVTQV